MVALALVVSVLALALIPRREFGDVQGTLLSGLVTGAALVSALLAWLSYSRKVDISKQDLHDQADRLATAVRKQWDEEIGRRELNARCPLPVRWVAADATLFDEWGALQALATVGIGWRGDRPSAWARGPAELAGAGDALKGVLKRVPTGRLVVLGEPGSGKTTLMVRLVLDMLAVREDGGTVPVLVSLASWNPQADDLNSWLAAQLSSDLGLADMGVSNLRGAALLRALLDERLLVPILDGLDEIPSAARAIAVTQINNALQPGESCVVTCRTNEFREALRAPGGPETTLRAAAGIQLCPLESSSDTEKVAAYLLTDAGGPEAKSRWAQVIDRLNPATPVGQALTTPLMVMLACTAYNPRPGGGAAEPRDPAELCAPALTSRADVELYLLDAFIPAAFSVNPDVAGRWNTAKACDWLVFLARHLDTTLDTTELAWWQLNRAVRPVVLGLLAGLVAGLGAAVAAGLGTAVHGPLIGLTAGLGAGLAFGLGIGIAITVTIAKWRRAPSLAKSLRRLHGLVPGIAAGLGAGLGTGIAFGLSSTIHRGLAAGVFAGLQPALIYGIANAIAVAIVAAGQSEPTPSRTLRWRFSFPAVTAAIAAGSAAGLLNGVPGGSVSGPVDGFIAGLAVTLAVGLAAGFTGLPGKAEAASSPRAVLRRDRGAATVITLCSGVGVGVLFALGYTLLTGLGVALTTGLVFGLVISTPRTAWPVYELARCWLALRGRLPWKLQTFLDDAHRLGVLRQVGTTYQFTHERVQHRLATRRQSADTTTRW
jgi:NACHT domain